MNRTLYITYDGLSDPLGGSQIIPYITSISSDNRKIIVLSFEKYDRFYDSKTNLDNILREHDILWKPLIFSSKFGLIGKIWDLGRMYFFGLFLAFKYSSIAVHARGHIAAQVGLFIKTITRSKLIFDFRGLWVDERVDKSGWNLNSAIDKMQYLFFKKIEKKLIKKSDHIIALTEAVVPELIRMGAKDIAKITVIPCCADFNHFKIFSDESRFKIRENLGIPKNSIVLGYLGSIGSIYPIDRVFRLLELSIKDNNNVYLFFITQDLKLLSQEMNRNLSNELHKNVISTSAIRSEVPKLVSAMDVLISFYQPTYARLATSPTKMAECFASGIPVICNEEVGDVKSFVNELDAGIIVDPFCDESISLNDQDIKSLIAKGGYRLRDKSKSIFSLDIASRSYINIYNDILEIE